MKESDVRARAAAQSEGQNWQAKRTTDKVNVTVGPEAGSLQGLIGNFLCKNVLVSGDLIAID
jgi:hypothetical protein